MRKYSKEFKEEALKISEDMEIKIILTVISLLY